MGLETIALVGMGLGAALGAAGTLTSAKANANQAKYQAAVAENNQIIAEREATYAETVAAQQEVEEVYKVRAALGEVKADQAASGLDVSTGSKSAVMGSLRGLGLRSIKNVRDTARREPYALQLQADQFGNDANAFTRASRSAMLGGALGAAGNLLAGASNVGVSFLDLRSSGVPYDDIEITS